MIEKLRKFFNIKELNNVNVENITPKLGNARFIPIQNEEDDTKEDIELIEKLNKKYKNELMKLHKKGQLSNINLSKIEDIEFKAINNTLKEFKEEKKEQGKKETVKNIETLKNQLSMFVTLSTDVVEINNKKFFNNFQDLLKILPRRFKNDNKLLNDEQIKTFKENNDNRMSNSTINNRMTLLNEYIDFCIRKGYLFNNNNNKTIKLQQKKKHIESFTYKELKDLLDDKNKIEKEYKDFFKLQLYTGVRISEGINIKKTDIDINNRILIIRDGKTENAKRMIPINDNLIDIIIDKLKINRKYLFFDNNQKDFINSNTKTVNRRIKRICNKSSHGLRKCFIQQLYKYQLDENTIKVLAGHSTTDNITFNIYNLNKIDKEKVINVINSIDYTNFNSIEETEIEKDFFY